MTTSAVSDDQLTAVLAEGAGAEILRRAPYAYATSWPLEEVELELPGGEHVRAILKDLSWRRLSPSARAVKSQGRHDPRREIETYRELLGPAAVGPRCYGSGDTWLLLEKVPGVELWQVGDFEVWEATARWLAAFHLAFTGTEPRPYLEVYDADRQARVVEEAGPALAASVDPRAARVRELLEAATRGGDAGAVTLVHGELYPSNVLVAGNGKDLRVWPIDWETAGVGPGALDLAALCAGWQGDERERLIGAYASAAGADAGPLRREVERWRLYLALQWLTRRTVWQPPPEHDQDWLGEALDAAEAVLA